MTPAEFIASELHHHCSPADSERLAITKTFVVDARDGQYAVATDGHHLVAIRREAAKHDRHDFAEMVAAWLDDPAPGARINTVELRLWCLSEPWGGARRQGLIGGHVFDRRLVARALDPCCGDMYATDVFLTAVKARGEHMLRIAAHDRSWVSIVMSMQPALQTFGRAIALDGAVTR